MIVLLYDRNESCLKCNLNNIDFDDQPFRIHCSTPSSHQKSPDSRIQSSDKSDRAFLHTLKKRWILGFTKHQSIKSFSSGWGKRCENYPGHNIGVHTCYFQCPHAYIRCTYTEHLMSEIRDLMQGFTVSQGTNNVVYICIQYFFHNIVIVFVRNY